MRKAFLIVALAAISGVSATAEEYDDGITGKMEFRGDLGGAYGTRKDKSIYVDLGGGYNFTDYFYLGAATGAYPFFGAPIGGNPGLYVPVMGDMSFRYNDVGDKWSLYFSLRGGLYLHTKGVDKLDATAGQYEGAAYTYRNYRVFEAIPGVIYRTRRNIDIRFSAGYCLAVPTNDGFNPTMTVTQHMFEMRVGVGLRGKPKTANREELRRQQIEESTARQRAEMEELERQEAKERAEGERRAKAEREAKRQQREASARAAAEQAIF